MTGLRTERKQIVDRTRLGATLAWLLFVVCALWSHGCSAFTPDVDHRAIAGLWKLKQMSYPLKEFTVYPKVPGQQKNDVLLMLKEDGSFEQYSSDDDSEKAPDKMRFFKDEKDKTDSDVLDRYCEFGKLKGKWDLIGGKLILAADRPTDDQGKSKSLLTKTKDITDTILEGQVVATTEEGLIDNPVLKDQTEEETPEKSSDSKAIAGDNTVNKRGQGAVSKGSVLDTHLSVPKGQVNVGRFTYPIHHPSFFDAPMFNPRAGGKFELKQVLGTLNTQQLKDDEFEERFFPSDFYNKTFLLSTHPIPQYRPKGNTRWSIRQNKFVEDPPPKSKKQKEEEELDKPAYNIRVVEVKFFANNTFATIGGMGGSTILRGKFSVIGKKCDQIWMQVLRFGFGRSVSGSVYSEGRTLTKDDEKAYWGEIEYEEEEDDNQSGETTENSQNPVASTDETKEDTEKRLIVKGTVIFGYGLEPTPVGKFVLTETNSVEEDDLDEDDEEDDEEEEGDIDSDGDSFLEEHFFDSDNAFQ